MKGFRQLKWRDRVRLEELLKFHTNHKVIFDYLFKSSYMPV